MSNESIWLSVLFSVLFNSSYRHVKKGGLYAIGVNFLLLGAATSLMAFWFQFRWFALLNCEKQYIHYLLLI